MKKKKVLALKKIKKQNFEMLILFFLQNLMGIVFSFTVREWTQSAVCVFTESSVTVSILCVIRL